uniref:C2H2-type domain-containing protein n=1 Tax=Electrophorus electricus TaxID=8005 RepID=A0A4W4EN26_ELEEL
MEAEQSQPADGERSGGQQQPLSDSSLRGRLLQLQEQATSQPIHGAHGRHQHRQPKRSDMLQRQQQQQSQVGESSCQRPDVPGLSRGSYSSSTFESSTQVPRGQRTPSQHSQEVLEGTTSRRERKPQKPGKYVCTYCGRPCAKPSVLQKHIRSHTGERPYPCVPCGFSFKTKSNLYKHRKSHAHRIKAGLASSREDHSFSGAESGTVGDEQGEEEAESTDSEDETGQRRPSTSQERPALRKSSKVELSFSEEGPRPEDSQAIKQRLAMRLSERKRVPMAPDETPSSLLGPGSKGSTESGYFSSSGSAELSQVSPPNANVKSYAEIILGKYGRMGQQQRIPHQHLKSSIESPKFSSSKDPCVFDPKGDVPGTSYPLAGRCSSAVLLRSQSVPSSGGQADPASTSSQSFRLSHSFDEQQAAAAEMRVGHHHRMLRRQPAIEMPIGADPLEFKAMAVAVRKRRKEESLEEDPPSPGPANVSFSNQLSTSVMCTKDDFQSLPSTFSQIEPEKIGPYKEISVIQHTSSFEKQESMSIESQEPELEHEQSQEPKQTSTSRLVRQPSIQVPEILVTEEPDTEMVSPPTSTFSAKVLDKEEFQWPQRSQSLAQLPAEKLPPKKKRLRLAEATQSSGESSFESVSLSHSPSQESNVSHTSSRSASFDESGKIDSEMQAGTWSSKGSHMLTVPGPHQHHHSYREMRRSASEQAPASPPHPAQMGEARSKSFDYGSMSPKPSSASWKERRKCLLVKHATLGKPDQEEPSSSLQCAPILCQSYSDHSAISVGEHRTRNTSTLNPEILGLPVQPLPTLLPLQFPSSGQPVQLPSGPSVAESSSSPSSIHSPGLLYHQLVTHHQPRPVIATCLEQFTPVVSLVVPVRLQTHIPTYATAMYTTISQILVTTRSQQPICCTAMVIMGQLEANKLQHSYLRLPTLDIKTSIPMSLPLVFQSETTSDDGCGPLGAGGNKRMLSPAGSLELSLEAQRQQKRVKEEEEEAEEEERGEDKSGEKSLEKSNRIDKEMLSARIAWGKQVKKTEEVQESVENKLELAQVEPGPFKKEEREEESHRCVSLIEIPERATDPLYPSLHTTTSVSWCYLNYTKPNPAAHRNPQTSVYSSWSVSMYNPNLPGLSTKMALSLLCSKQIYSSEIFTTATAPPPTTDKLVAATVKVKGEPLSKRSEKEKKNIEEGPTTSKQSEPPRICIFEGGYKSSEEYVYVRGRGRGKYVCGECGIRCKKPSMLKKHIRTHTDIRPYVCKHCNFAFKTKGESYSKIDFYAALTPPFCLPGTSEGQFCESEDAEEHQFSDVEDSEDEDDNDEDDDDDDDNDEEEEVLSSHDEPPSSCSTDTHQSDSGQGSQTDLSNPTVPETEDHQSPCRPWSSGRAASPGSKRALFSHKGWEVSPRAFSPASEGSPLRSLSPRLELSSPSRHLSPSPERGPSPVRASLLRPLSPLQPLSPAHHRSSRERPGTPSTPVQERPATPGVPQAPQRLSPPHHSLLLPTLRICQSDSSTHLSVATRTMDRMFSHLPLHSQDQARMPYHMIPIGGIQMVQLRPRPCPKLERSSSLTPSPTSPKEDFPFCLSKRDTLWSSRSETSQQKSLAVSGTQSLEREARLSGLQCQATCSTTAKWSLQHGSMEPREKDRKQYGSSQPSKTYSVAPETSQSEVSQDNSEGAEKISSFDEEEARSSLYRTTEQLSELERPKETPSQRCSSTSEGTLGEKSTQLGKSQDGNPDST